MGFNPCCPGSIPSTRPGGSWAWWSAIVSILVVLDLSHRRFNAELAPLYDDLFQSLLSWIYPIDENQEKQLIVDYKFQSLLSWIYPIDTLDPPCNRQSRSVSILVVLDLSHRLRGFVLCHSVDRSFNPCCPGSIPSTPLHEPHSPPARPVSILVVLDLSHRR